MGPNYNEQYYTTFFANFGSFAYGIILGWVSPIIPLLESESTPLPCGPISSEDSSWIVSGIGIGGFLGLIIMGFMVDKLGRKFSLYFSISPIIFFWLLAIFAQNSYYLIVARAIVGISSSGVFLVTPLYVAEIADDKIRGTLGAALLLSCTFGMMVGLAGGAYLDYYVNAYISLLFPIIMFIGLYRVPDTPSYYFSKKQYVKAINSTKFYAGLKSSSDLSIELSTMNSINSSSSEKVETKLKCSDFCSRAAVKALIITTVTLLMTQLSGTFVLINYAATIFEEAGSNFDPNMSSIIVGALQFFGSIASIVLVDRAGRKNLLALSSLFTAIFFLVMGFYSFYKEEVSQDLAWIPVVCLSGATFMASWGTISLPYIIIAEILPQKTRSIIMSIFLALLWIVSFLMLKYYLAVVDLISTAGCMWIFGGACLLETIFTLAFIPETKGKSIEENVAALGRRKSEIK